MPARIIYVKFDGSKGAEEYVHTSSSTLQESYAAHRTNNLPLAERLEELKGTKVVRVGESDEDSVFSEGVLISRNLLLSSDANPDEPSVLFNVGFPFEFIDGPTGSAHDLTETQAVHMTIQLDAEIQRSLAEHPEDPVEVRMVGTSRGAVSASIVQRNLKALYGSDARVTSQLVELDPVAGGGKRVNMRMQSTYDVRKDPACHLRLVERLKSRHSPEAQAAAQEPQNIRPEDSIEDFQTVSVVYSINSEQTPSVFGRAIAYFGFDPQSVHGADQVIITDAKHTGLYEELAMSPRRIAEIQKLRSGVMVLPTKKEGHTPNDLVNGHVNGASTYTTAEGLGFPSPPEGQSPERYAQQVERWRRETQTQLHRRGLTAPNTTSARERVISSALADAFYPGFRDDEFERTTSRPMTATGGFTRAGAHRQGRPESRMYTQPYVIPLDNEELVRKLEQETGPAVDALVDMEIERGSVKEEERASRKETVLRTRSLEQIQAQKDFVSSGKYEEAVGLAAAHTSTILEGEPGCSPEGVKEALHAVMRDKTPAQAERYSALVVNSSQIARFKSEIGQYGSTGEDETREKREDFRRMIEETPPELPETLERIEKTQTVVDYLSAKLQLSPEATAQLKETLYLGAIPTRSFSYFVDAVEAKHSLKNIALANRLTTRREPAQQKQERIEREVLADVTALSQETHAGIVAIVNVEILKELTEYLRLEQLQPERADLIRKLSTQAGVGANKGAFVEVHRYICKASTSELVDNSFQDKVRDIGDILQAKKYSLPPDVKGVALEIAMKEEIIRVLYKLSPEQLEAEALQARNEIDARIVVSAQTAQLAPAAQGAPQGNPAAQEAQNKLKNDIREEAERIRRLHTDPRYRNLSRDDIKYVAAQMRWRDKNPGGEMEPETILRFKEKAYAPIEPLPEVRQTTLGQIGAPASQALENFRQADAQFNFRGFRREVSPLAQAPSRDQEPSALDSPEPQPQDETASEAPEQTAASAEEAVEREQVINEGVEELIAPKTGGNM